MLTMLVDQLIGYGVWMFLLAAKATLLLLLALAAGRLLQDHSARARHALWTITFVALATLPLLQGAMPDMPVPGLSWARALASTADSGLPRSPAAAQRQFPSTSGAGDSAARLSNAQPAGVPQIQVPSDRPMSREIEPAVQETTGQPLAPTVAWRQWVPRWGLAGLAAVWLLGTVLILALLGLAVFRARRIVSRAPLVRHAGWLRDYEQARAQLGMRRAISLRVTEAIDSPMAGGVLAPFVLLPREALGWPAARRRVVLQHELAHLRGLDPLRALVARVAAALYWFQPLVWVAGRDAVLARESACDETVVELGTRPSLYATVLLELAGSSGSSPIPAMVLPMIQRSLLETRLMSILKSDRPRGGRSVLLAVVFAMSAVTLSVAAAAPQEEAPPPPRAEKVKPAPKVPPLPDVAPAPAVVPAPEVWSHRIAPVPGVAASPAPMVAPAPSTAPYRATAPQVEPAACVWDRDGSGSFSGSMSMRGEAGEGRVVEAVGHQDGDRMIRKMVDGMTICMRGEGEVAFRDDMGAIEHIGDSGRVLLATIDGDQVVEMEITGMGPEAMSWSVNGVQRAVDADAREWRDSLMETLGHQWHISTLRGEASSLRGEISSTRGQLSSLRGEASSLRGEASSLRGEASSARGEASSLRGELSSLRGEVSAMRGKISSHRGTISALESQRHGASVEQAQELDRQIADHQAVIGELERQIANFDLEAKVEAYERRIEDLHADTEAEALQAQARELEESEQMEALQARIQEYQEQSEGEIERLHEQIEALDLDTRIPAIEQQLELSVQHLERVLQRLR